MNKFKPGDQAWVRWGYGNISCQKALIIEEIDRFYTSCELEDGRLLRIPTVALKPLSWAIESKLKGRLALHWADSGV